MNPKRIVDTIKKLIPHAEAEQESLRQMQRFRPEEYKEQYEDCMEAISYAYETLDLLMQKKLHSPMHQKQKRFNNPTGAKKRK